MKNLFIILVICGSIGIGEIDSVLAQTEEPNSVDNVTEEAILRILAMIGFACLLMKFLRLLDILMDWFGKIENPSDKLKIVLFAIGGIGIAILNTFLYYYGP